MLSFGTCRCATNMLLKNPFVTFMNVLGGQHIPCDFFGNSLPDIDSNLCDRQFLTTLFNATLWNLARKSPSDEY
eukprot:4452679-Karenia_brevis.AAC.1